METMMGLKMNVETGPGRCWENLANAVIQLAAEDYCEALVNVDDWKANREKILRRLKPMAERLKTMKADQKEKAKRGEIDATEGAIKELWKKVSQLRRRATELQHRIDQIKELEDWFLSSKEYASYTRVNPRVIIEGMRRKAAEIKAECKKNLEEKQM